MYPASSITMGEIQATLIALVLGCVLVVWKQRRSHAQNPITTASSHGDVSPSSNQVMHDFQKFQTSYLTVYLLCTFSDWLKGPYVYALYEVYGFSQSQIAWLFVGGFLSSLVFGTFVGSLSDKYGRKRLCIVFCFVYGASAFTKLVNSFAVLFFGRVLSGIATSLLFTAFESWMVSEHKARQFPEHLMANTFSKAILGNGAVAVLAGLVAQGAATCCGFVAPFLVAVPCLLAAALLMLSWNENYGNQSIHVRETLLRGWDSILREKKLFYLGACQSLFEGCMYVWVFYWTPALRASDDEPVAFGLVFACYMAALMIGGIMTDLIPMEKLVTPMHCACILATASAALFFHHKLIVFLMFTLFEGLVGVYFGAHGMLRSVHMEESTRASVMNIFRVPLNIFVVTMLQIPMTPRHALLVLTLAHIVSLGSLMAFWKHAPKSRRDGTNTPTLLGTVGSDSFSTAGKSRD